MDQCGCAVKSFIDLSVPLGFVTVHVLSALNLEINSIIVHFDLVK